MKRLLSGLACISLAAASITAAFLTLGPGPAAAAPENGITTLCDLTLTGREMTYQLYLPANPPLPEEGPASASREFNQATAVAPLDIATRIYWEWFVSDRAGEKTLANPELTIGPVLTASIGSPATAAGEVAVSAAGDVKAWVHESGYGDARYGSFILPAQTGMAIRVSTGAWEKRTALFSRHPGAFTCRLKIYYRPADRGLPPTLSHLDAPTFNRTINELIKNREPEIKASLLNENLYDISFRKVDFRIETGVLQIGFTAYYQGRTILGIPFRTQADGTVAYEVRYGNDADGGAPRLGLYCQGLVGPFDIPGDLGLLDRWGRSYINQKISGRQYWTAPLNSPAIPGETLPPGDGPVSGNQTQTAAQPPVTYLVFKNDNLSDIVNRALMTGLLKPFEFEFPGGRLKITFREAVFQEFNLSEGKAKGLCRLDAELTVLGLDSYRIDNAGTIDPLALDFYIDEADQSWWGRMTGFHLELGGLSPLWNGILNDIITKKMAQRHGLVPLPLPGLPGDAAARSIPPGKEP